MLYTDIFCVINKVFIHSFVRSLIQIYFFSFPGLRCLRDVDLNIKSNIETLLTNKVHGGGGWRQVASNYEMDELHIDSLEGNPDAGKSVISYLKATYPDLTVYDFCKTLRERNIRRFDIIQKLLGQLSVPAPKKAS